MKCTALFSRTLHSAHHYQETLLLKLYLLFVSDALNMCRAGTSGNFTQNPKVLRFFISSEQCQNSLDSQIDRTSSNTKKKLAPPLVRLTKKSCSKGSGEKSKLWKSYRGYSQQYLFFLVKVILL